MRDGFSIIPNWVMRDKELTAYEKLVYTALSGYTDSEGFCYPSHKTLADQLQVSKRTVLRALQGLRERGLVQWVGRIDRGGGQTSNYYQLTTQVVPDFTLDTPVTESHPLRPSVTPPMTDSHTPYDSQSHEQKPINNNQLTKRDSLTEGVAGFDEFWEAYPKHVDKPGALKAYAEALTKASSETLIRKARQYADYIKATNTNSRYVLYPASWLKCERWEDEYATAPTDSNREAIWS